MKSCSPISLFENRSTSSASTSFSLGDNGSGIPVEVAGKIFEPFYTTKEAGMGTGLGLATVYGIVHQHHGYITVKSGLGEGASFRVYLEADYDRDN